MAEKFPNLVTLIAGTDNQGDQSGRVFWEIVVYFEKCLDN
jgi:hypothetical protein